VRGKTLPGGGISPGYGGNPPGEGDFHAGDGKNGPVRGDFSRVRRKIIRVAGNFHRVNEKMRLRAEKMIPGGGRLSG